MEKQTVNSYEIAIQQKRMCQYIIANDLPKMRIWQIIIKGKPAINKLNSALNQCIEGTEIFFQVYDKVKGFDFPVTRVIDQKEELLITFVLDEHERKSLACQSFFNGRPVSAFLVNTNDGRYTFELHLPALSFDKTSYRLFFDELRKNYTSATIIDKEDQIQFIDLSEWQNELLAEEGTQGKAYWNQVIEKEFPLTLPYAKGQHVFKSDLQKVELNVPAELMEKAERFCTANNLSLNTYLLSVYSFLLQRLCASENVAIGVLANGRNSEEIKDAYGCLDQFVPMIGSQIPSDTFLQLAVKVSQTLETTTKWQFFYDAGEMASAKQIAADYLPFLFEFESINSPVKSGDVTFYAQESFVIHHGFDICLGAIQNTAAGDLKIEMAFNANQYDEAYIKALGNQYLNLLEVFAEATSKPLADIAIATPQEQEQILQQFNQPVIAKAESNLLLHELFENHAKTWPQNIAVNADGREITYAELGNLSDSVANYLLSKGIEKGEIVALLTERSADTIVGLLGILKAGAAYLPIAATYPADRVATMLETANVKKVILQQKLSHRIDEGNNALQIYIDADPQVTGFNEKINSNHEATPEDAAYVIFTSGSTGRPKACVLKHSNIVNYILAINQRVLADATVGNFPFFTPISFDFTLTGLLGSLINGKTLFVFGEDIELNTILETCFDDSTAMDAIKLTPSHVLILDHLPVVSQKIKLVMTGGEALRKSHVDIIRKKAPNARIINHYGPTETTVGCITGEVSADDEKIYLGKPIGNLKVYIADANGQLAPIGVPGEILIGGLGVSAGYFGSPELTAQKFIANHWDGGTFYKTGDVGRWLPDGRIEYFGRNDDQVKIRGNRVEPGEIAVVMNTYPGIEKTIVLADKDNQGNNILIAYYTSAQGKSLQSESIREFLNGLLPDYMAPAFFVQVNAFPVTQNGKLDTKALLKTDYRLQSTSDDTSPQNKTQEQLMAIWKEVLKVENIGIYSDFFELGGHSLLAMQIISRVREVFNKQVQLRALFRYPTIQLLQEHIDLTDKSDVETPLIKKQGDDSAVPMSYAQKRLWFLQQLNPAGTMYNMPVLMKLTGDVSVQALKSSFDYLCTRHAILRTVFKSENEVPVQLVNAGLFNNYFSIEDLSTLDEAGKETAFASIKEKEYNHVFNLENGPLLKVSLVRMSEDEWYLLLNIHHIVMDEWSVTIFTNELSQCYNALIQNQHPALPVNEYSYADFSAWQAEMLAQTAAPQKSFWKKKLENANTIINLPFAKPRQVKESFAGGVISFDMDNGLSEKINSLGKQQQASAFMVLYTAYALLLNKYTNLKDLLVGAPVANRNYRETENLLGFFVNTLVIRTQFEEVKTFSDLLNLVKEEVTDAFANQDLPFEELIRELNISREPGYSPMFQNCFVVHNGGEEKTGLHNVRVEDIPVTERQAKFDTLLSVDNGSQLKGYLEYNAELFDESDMQTFINDYQNILKQITDNPNISLDNIATEIKGESIIATPTLAKEITPESVAQPAGVMTVTEQQLTTIWKNLMPHARIDRNSDFFLLGGHSLQVIVLRTRVNEAFAIDAPVRMFFDCPALIAMAAQIAELITNKTEDAAQAPAPIAKVSRQQYKLQ